MSDYTKSTLDDQKRQILDNLKSIDDSTFLLIIVQSLTFAYARSVQKPLVELLYKHNVTQREIGDALGITDAAVSLQFPKGGKK